MDTSRNDEGEGRENRSGGTPSRARMYSELEGFAHD